MRGYTLKIWSYMAQYLYFRILEFPKHSGFVFSVASGTSSTAQAGGGSFKIGNLEERLVVANHGWQSEATDGSMSIYLSIYRSIYLSIYLSTLVS